jgi:hypothetical protein
MDISLADDDLFIVGPMVFDTGDVVITTEHVPSTRRVQIDQMHLSGKFRLHVAEQSDAGGRIDITGMNVMRESTAFAGARRLPIQDSANVPLVTANQWRLHDDAECRISKSLTDSGRLTWGPHSLTPPSATISFDADDG